MSQPDLFPTGEPTRADIERIVGRMFPDYHRLVCECALEVAAANDDFTAEDVRLHCEPKEGQENTFSNAMLEAKRIGIMKVVNYRKSGRREAKGRMIPVYRRAFQI